MRTGLPAHETFSLFLPRHLNIPRFSSWLFEPVLAQGQHDPFLKILQLLHSQMLDLGHLLMKDRKSTNGEMMPVIQKTHRRKRSVLSFLASPLGDKYVYQAKQNDPQTPAPTRSPLPKRRGRNEDPVGKRAKAARVAATKAAKQAKEVDKQKRMDEASIAKERLAEMEADESFARDQECQGRVRRQSDMAVGARDKDKSNSEGEFAGLNQMDFSTDESEPSDNESEVLQKKSGATVSFLK